MPSDQVPEWGYTSTEPLCSSPYLVPVLRRLSGTLGPGTRVLDLGCGNGFNAGVYVDAGCQVVGVDPSAAGIRIARSTYPNGRFEVLGVSDDLLAQLREAPFDLVVSTEVVEHLYDPAAWARCAFACLKPGGKLVCSTPYHGYIKNLVIALADGFDNHVQPMDHGGHIKFWSHATLSALLIQAGFRDIQFAGAGRFAWMWKSMVLSAVRHS